MLDRRVADFAQAIAGIGDGATILLGGFGGAGTPLGLVAAVHAAGLKDLTVIANNGGSAEPDLSLWLAAGQVRKLVCSYPKSKLNTTASFSELYLAGKIELELVPQGTLVERIRCGGAGLGGFYTPVGAGTALAEGKETRMIDGREHVLEKPIRADVALLRARQADRLGNLTYNMAARNFAPVMATAAELVVAEVEEFVEPGAIDPEAVVTPGIFVDRVVLKGAPR
ncbi:3-oxoadipate CoA-transferase [Pseudoroseomonas deserti]|uniref:3-oxoadipate CoA-transferase n=1 Tax=Teichococcus deserti TaxID=1817963 RepID=A0A1V2H5X6_9PROT|nr:3-oxoacid CoA-transferase subunit A [Pseudoroseomonas deserti]ONG57025.1 3-oxoadipate CoA-transferase [Pseudoroseomonas deserti]